MSAKLLQKQEVGKWSDTFPEEMTSFKQSLIFMKRLLGVAICNITYLRLMFPDDAYVDKSLEGIPLKVLKNSEKYPQVNNLIVCLKGVFESLEKKYLKTLVFLIHPDPSNLSIVVESYAFAFSYDSDNEISIFNKKEKVASVKCGMKTKGATIKLLRRLILLCSTLNPLPDVFSISMKLYYYDEVTPSDYEPPGFDAAPSIDDTFNGDSKQLDVGEIDTLYHSCTLQLTTKKDEYDDDDDDNDVIQATAANLCLQNKENTKGNNNTNNNNTDGNSTDVSNIKNENTDTDNNANKVDGDTNDADSNVESIYENVTKLRIMDNIGNSNTDSEAQQTPHNNNTNKKSQKRTDSKVSKYQHSQRVSRKKKFVEETDDGGVLQVEGYENSEPPRKSKERKLSRSSKIDIDVGKGAGDSLVISQTKRKGKR